MKRAKREGGEEHIRRGCYNVTRYRRETIRKLTNRGKEHVLGVTTQEQKT